MAVIILKRRRTMWLGRIRGRILTIWSLVTLGALGALRTILLGRRNIMLLRCWLIEIRTIESRWTVLLILRISWIVLLGGLLVRLLLQWTLCRILLIRKIRCYIGSRCRRTIEYRVLIRLRKWRNWSSFRTWEWDVLMTLTIIRAIGPLVLLGCTNKTAPVTSRHLGSRRTRKVT